MGNVDGIGEDVVGRNVCGRNVGRGVVIGSNVGFIVTGEEIGYSVGGGVVG
jgi:hypothetical protein